MLVHSTDRKCRYFVDKRHNNRNVLPHCCASAMALAKWFESQAVCGLEPLGEVRGAGPPAKILGRPLGMSTTHTLKMDRMSKAY